MPAAEIQVPKDNTKQMRFIDLFAGLGGFHLALRNLGHECVFASEVDETLRELYRRNFGMEAVADIREVNVANIPPHDILCAGFPCQPFSKAGDQSGLDDQELGDLYLQILRVIRYHQPRYLILENVPNLEKHDQGQTWDIIKHLLEAEGYHVSLSKLSPHQFGIPQIRERMYIVGSIRPLDGFQWPKKRSEKLAIQAILDDNPVEARRISGHVQECLETWQDFLDSVPMDEKIPHPLWSMEFGATYPYEWITPWSMDLENLRMYRGSFGRPLSERTTHDEVFAILPSHARTAQPCFPRWKVQFISRNRHFYDRHKAWLDDWVQKIMAFPCSFQKLEWNCQEKDPTKEIRRLDRYVIQIRPSGVRVKRPTTSPSLVAMTMTQVPIIAWEKRYITMNECKRLQSMDELEWLPDSPTKAYAALGNAINVEVAELVAGALLKSSNSPHDEVLLQHGW